MNGVTLPLEYCDIVMKGGVTSGVIYPLTAADLSEKYTFKNVGGTSAGAIAAAATAAAEYRRRTGSGEGFEALRRLPETLGKAGFLLSLFSPDPQTRPLFRALLSVAESGHPLQAAIRIWFALVTGYPRSAIAGAVLGAAIPLVLWAMGQAGTLATLVLGTLWVVTSTTVAVAIAAATTLPALLRQNRFGLCSGFRRDQPTGQPPLVNWLYGFLNDIANLPSTQPLTFRHLHEAPVGNDVTGTPRAINLEMMTTNLTHGRPHRLPFPEEEAATFYFSPAEWADFFPPEVIEHLKGTSQERPRLTNAENLELYPIPSDDLPVIVAVRLSLSFPGLFSAVPMWSVDFTRRRNQNLPRDAPRTAERCWFSDGGLSSNFPVHLFDAPLPRWPTFAVNLKDPHPDFLEEKDFVWLPSSNGAGLQPRWNRFDAGSAARQIGGFVGALIDSMQSWRDNLAARMPGYRNRIVHITQTSDEGGLNLSMPPEAIARLGSRGRRAGELLRTEFDFENHAWVRYRAYISALWSHLQPFADAYNHPVPQDESAWRFVKGDAPPPPFPSYTLTAAEARELAQLTATLVEAFRSTTEPAANAKSPRPRPELRSVPPV